MAIGPAYNAAYYNYGWNPAPSLQGWVCPLCRAVYAPHVQQCYKNHGGYVYNDTTIRNVYYNENDTVPRRFNSEYDATARSGDATA